MKESICRERNYTSYSRMAGLVADRTRLGLWPSDHAGVMATLTLQSRDNAE
jgi:hypothetical protein